MSKDQFQTEINSKTTVAGLREAMKATTAKYGYRGGTWSHVKIKEGWLMAVVYAIPGGHDHWNYHPARKELVKSHTTMGVINVAEALDETIQALERLYPQDE
jgi:hypothetical protein